METPNLSFLISSLIFIIFFFSINNTTTVEAQAVIEGSSLPYRDTAEATEIMPMAVSLYGGDFGDSEEENEEMEGDEYSGEGTAGRRSLFWRTMKYYISYGALSADRIPCPPRSGRSYYTHNCHLARGPVRPYYRGCSAITRCRR